MPWFDRCWTYSKALVEAPVEIEGGRIDGTRSFRNPPRLGPAAADLIARRFAASPLIGRLHVTPYRASPSR
jgi:hypothetical protein